MNAIENQAIVDAIRKVTSKVQKAIESGRRSASLDVHDLVDILLDIANELDPE